MSHWLPEIRQRLAAANLDPAREAEIAAELEAHLEERYRETRARGLDHDEARRAALDELRDDHRMTEELAALEARERPVVPLGDPNERSWGADVWQDIRYALRMMRRNPRFATLAVFTLAIGVGATTVVYAIVDNLLLRPVPYQHVDRLVRVFETPPNEPDKLVSAAYANLMDWQARSRSFEALGRYRSRTLTLADGDPESVAAGVVTPGFLSAAGAQPLLGRALTEADTAPGAPRVVMLSHGAWQRRFGGDPGVIGRSLKTADGSYEIVGVLTPVKMFEGAREFWIPFVATSGATRSTRDAWVLGRLRSGVTIEEARAEMSGVAAALANEHPENRGWGVTLMPMQEWTVRGMRQPLYTFFGAVACILLIACANVAGLLVARGASRSGEIAIRTSLGARRFRIIRQLVTESLVLAVVGGGLGALLAWLLIGTLVPLFPIALPAEWIAVDLRVLAIAIAASGMTGILFGLAPAITLSRQGAAATLKDQARSTSSWGRRVGSGLIVMEVALSLMLLAGAGLMVRTMTELYAVDPGIDADRVVALRAAPLLPLTATAGRMHFYQQLTERVAAAPGVVSAAAVNTPPFGGATVVQDAVSDVVSTPTGVSPRAVTPRYFETMGTDLIAGRDFSSADTATSGKVVIVNQTTAAKLWPGQSPIGRQLRFGGTTGEPREVIGVIADVRHEGLDSDAIEEVYQPLSQRPALAFEMTVVARASDPDAVVRQFRGMLNGLPERALFRSAQTFAAMIDGTVAQRRNRAILLGVLAALGLVLAAIGVFGLMAWSVAQRTREIGIRIALGAGTARVLRTVIGSLVPPLALGVLLGTAGAWWATRILKSFLWGVEPNDPLTFVAVVLVITAVSLLASYLPARRALRVDPMMALRAE